MKKAVKGLVVSASMSMCLLPTSMLTGCGNDGKVETHIVSINDFHGAAPGFGEEEFVINYQNAGAVRLANEAQEIINKYPGSYMLSCGDYNAGEAFSTVTHAETLYPVLHAMNITYSAVGNHAWEWGSEHLEDHHWDEVARTDQTNGNYFVTSNVLTGSEYRDDTWCVNEQDPKYQEDYTKWHDNLISWADPYKILDMNGHNVCIIGLTTKGTLVDGNLNAIKDLAFIDYNASVTYTKTLAKSELGEEKFNSIEAFILLTHCECQPNSVDPTIIEGEAADLAKNATTRIDGILAAHSHRECSGLIKNEKFGNMIPVAQASQAGRRYVDTKLVFNDGKPVGQRLESISMNVKTPFIDYGKNDPTKPEELEKAKACARKQLNDIIDNTKNKVVKKTIEEYTKQKEVALRELDKPLGVLKDDVHYYFTEHPERSFGTQYMQSDTLIEPAGAWANKAQIWGFNEEYKDNIKAGELYPACVSLINLDSLKTGFLLGDKETERDLLTKEIFQMHSFENSTYYGCLTPAQLEQYINYFLEGAARFDYSGEKKAYGYEADEVEITMDGKSTGESMIYDANEKAWILNAEGAKEIVNGTSYVSGCQQFYGMSFEVEKKGSVRKDSGVEFQPYQYKSGSLKIYDPSNNACSLDDPKTWIEASNWKSFNGLIPVIMPNFTWQGGNGQNRMLHHWFKYNGENVPAPAAQEHALSQITRNYALNYCKYLTGQKRNIDDGINYDFMKNLIQINI